MARYIFVIGGVMSGIGKGVATASIAKILKAKGYRVTAVKIDPYLNVDAGTMNPVEHGEVFVTKDGVECDQDIGNYERFLDEELTEVNYMTSGRVYQSVIERERNLEYGGKCVEAVPHVPDEIIGRLKRAAKETNADFVLIEVGGTAGEYQNLLFFEAARMMHLKDPKKVLFVLVSYLPIPDTIGEMKTKPTQMAVRTLNAAGIQPDIILARSKVPLDEPRKRKLSIFCNIDQEDVISAPDVEAIYEVPINFEKEHLGERILKKFRLTPKHHDLRDWKKLVRTIKGSEKTVRIGIVGKYFATGEFTLLDSYISVIEAIKHAAWAHNRNVDIQWLSAQTYEKTPQRVRELKKYDGIIIPGGFGGRGTEGKIAAVKYCRTHGIPFLGLCLGMQLAVIEFARNAAGLKDAHSREFSKKTPQPVIDVMADQKELLKEKRYGGTMRLGDYLCKLKPGTTSFTLYQKMWGSGRKTKQLTITERHRHRYEVNNKFREQLEDTGLVMAGINPEQDLVEIIELPKHPFFVGTQFHPEFKSRPLAPHPLFYGLLAAAVKRGASSQK